MSARYQQLDSDEERLSTGMTRVAYDTDKQRYTYKDADGSMWEGEEGARYGRLHRVGAPHPLPTTSAADLAAQNRAAWRYMFPFFLLVGAFLVFVWRITTPSSAPPVQCADTDTRYTIVQGDTCYGIAENFGVDVDRLRGANENLGLICERLVVGREICVPTRKEV